MYIPEVSNVKTDEDALEMKAFTRALIARVAEGWMRPRAAEVWLMAMIFLQSDAQTDKRVRAQRHRDKK